MFAGACKENEKGEEKKKNRKGEKEQKLTENQKASYKLSFT